MSKVRGLKNMEGACVPLALQYLSACSIQQLIAACLFPGMDEDDMLKASKKLKLRFRKLSCGKIELRKFQEQYAEGRFLLFTHDHALVIENGKVVDPREAAGPRSVIHKAWRVL